MNTACFVNHKMDASDLLGQKMSLRGTCVPKPISDAVAKKRKKKKPKSISAYQSSVTHKQELLK